MSFLYWSHSSKDLVVVDWCASAIPYWKEREILLRWPDAHQRGSVSTLDILQIDPSRDYKDQQHPHLRFDPLFFLRTRTRTMGTNAGRPSSCPIIHKIPFGNVASMDIYIFLTMAWRALWKMDCAAIKRKKEERGVSYLPRVAHRNCTHSTRGKIDALMRSSPLVLMIIRSLSPSVCLVFSAIHAEGV